MKKIITILCIAMSWTTYGQIQQDVNKTSGTVSTPINDIDSIRFNSGTGVMEVILNNEDVESHTISDIDNVTFSEEHAPPTAVTATAGSNPVCEGSTLTLTGGATNATSWSWTGPNGFTSTIQSPTITNITTADAGVYTLIASNTYGSATAVNTASVTTVNAVPTAVSTSATPNPICEGNDLSLTGSATDATSWSWTGPNGFTSSSQNPTITSIITDSAGVYTLTASNDCGDAAEISTTVTVTASPSAGTLSGNQSICVGATTDLSSTQSGGSWSSSSTGTATVNGLGVVTGQSAGTAIITYTIDGTGGCSDATAMRTVTIKSCCGTPFTDARDSKTYRTVQIGNQIWMCENLNYTPSSGNSWCYYNDPFNCTTYGRLYDWNGAMDGSSSSPSDVQGVCPTGWHLPSDAEWQELEVALGMDPGVANTTGWRGNNEGDALKSSSNWDGNNSSGFTALPGGFRYTSGPFLNEGSGSWWSASKSGSDAWRRTLNSSRSDVYRNAYGKGNGLSVRCVRN